MERKTILWPVLSHLVRVAESEVREADKEQRLYSLIRSFILTVVLNLC